MTTMSDDLITVLCRGCEQDTLKEYSDTERARCRYRGSTFDPFYWSWDLATGLDALSASMAES